VTRRRLTKLSGPRSVYRCVRPFIGPIKFSGLSESEDGLDGEGHARLARSHRLVLAVVRNPWRGMKLGIDAVSAPRCYDAQTPRFGVLLDDTAKIPDGGARLNNCDGQIQAFSSCFDEADCVFVGFCLFSHVIRLVEICMIATVIQRYIEVDDVSILKGALIGYAMADNLVWGSAEGLGEMVVVERRGIRL
jgi:hypothetical protein